ncbi:unnamed protein product [Miscanthus lutarioriparius]|uniref:Uncharacterized protein n=1 Tax=Miscanthus lutarioriparius TaxID=422564 RepID=A0A811PS81_9POAL|nr:unnamed protein product [Miscanthus lutarioriparius]
MGEAPQPKSPPRYPDLCGRRRLQLEVQILNREVGFLEVAHRDRRKSHGKVCRCDDLLLGSRGTESESSSRGSRRQKRVPPLLLRRAAPYGTPGTFDHPRADGHGHLTLGFVPRFFFSVYRWKEVLSSPRNCYNTKERGGHEPTMLMA